MTTTTSVSPLAERFIAVAINGEPGSLEDILPPGANVDDFVSMRVALPDLRFNVEYLLADDKVAVAFGRLVGTHTADLPPFPLAPNGVPASGREVSIAAGVRLVFQDGRLGSGKLLFDFAKFFAKIGSPLSTS